MLFDRETYKTPRDSDAVQLKISSLSFDMLQRKN